MAWSLIKHWDTCALYLHLKKQYGSIEWIYPAHDTVERALVSMNSINGGEYID
jgi:hypothetical protein